MVNPGSEGTCLGPVTSLMAPGPGTSGVGKRGIRSAATAQLDGLCAIESKPGLLYNSERCARIVKGVPANSAANF